MDGEAFPLFAEGLSFVFKSEVRLLRSHDLQEGCARMNALRGSSVGIELPLVSACTAWEHHPEEPVIMKVLPVNASPFLGGRNALLVRSRGTFGCRTQREYCFPIPLRYGRRADERSAGGGRSGSAESEFGEPSRVVGIGALVGCGECFVDRRILARQRSCGTDPFLTFARCDERVCGL